MSDFDAEVINSLRQIQAQVESLKKSQDGASTSARNYGREATAAFKQAGQAAGESGKPLINLNQSLTKVALSPQEGLKDLARKFGALGAAAGGTLAVLAAVGSTLDGINRSIDETRRKSGDLSKSQAGGRLAVAQSLEGTDLDAGAILDTVSTARGPATQEQINAFAIKLSGAGIQGLDTANFQEAVRTYAKFAPVLGQGDALIERLRDQYDTGAVRAYGGRASLGEAELIRRQGALEHAIGPDLEAARAEREAEITENQVGGAGAVNRARAAARRRRAAALVGRGGAPIREAIDGTLENLPVAGGIFKAVTGARARGQDDSDSIVQAIQRQTDQLSRDNRPIGGGY